MDKQRENSFLGVFTYRGCILFSVSVHGMIFFSLAFTFPVKAVAHKPVFVFLGSILDKQEVSHVPYLREQLPNRNIVNPEQLQVESAQSQFYPIQTTAVPKPKFSGKIKVKPRMFLKSKFSINEAAVQGDSPSLEDLGVDLTVPPAPKLHLYAP